MKRDHNLNLSHIAPKQRELQNTTFCHKKTTLHYFCYTTLIKGEFRHFHNADKKKDFIKSTIED